MMIPECRLEELEVRAKPENLGNCLGSLAHATPTLLREIRLLLNVVDAIPPCRNQFCKGPDDFCTKCEALREWKQTKL